VEEDDDVMLALTAVHEHTSERVLGGGKIKTAAVPR